MTPRVSWELPGTATVTGSRGVIGRDLVSELTRCGVTVTELDLALGHDLSDEAFVSEWFMAHSTDVLINLFAENDHVDDRALETATYLEYPVETFDAFMRTNVTSLFLVCREYLRNHPGGSIVNFASIYGVSVPPRGLIPDREKSIAYGVSKAAVIQLTRHLAVYAAPQARVNCVVPGGVGAGQPAAFLDAYCHHVPLGRMATADDVIAAVLYLMSPAAAYLTGTSIVVDGGWTAA